MIENLLEKAKRKTGAAEAFVIQSDETNVSFDAGILKNANRKRSFGVVLRVIHEGRLGFSSSTDPGRIDDMVERAIAASKYGKTADFEFPRSADTCIVNTFDPAVESFSPETAVTEGNRTIEMLKERCPKGLTYTEFTSTVSTVRIANTTGLDLSYRETGFSQGVTMIFVDGDSILWISDGGSFGTLEMRTEQYVEHIAELAVNAEKKAPKITGNFPVIFAADQMPHLLQSVEMGVDGRRLLNGDSPLIGKSGERVLGSVTLTDDPRIDNAPGSRPFDDEGVPSRTNALFKDGVFQDFLFDLDTAAKTGNAATGSAHRGMLTQPQIGTSNLMLSGGSSDIGTMIAAMNEGVVVYDVLGGGQSNLIAGDFAFNVMLGFLVKNGEIIGRLSDTMLSGNVYSAFGNIAAMGTEIKPIGTVFTPDVMFTELSISGR